MTSLPAPRSPVSRLLAVLIVMLALVIASMTISILAGAAQISVGTIADALFRPDGSFDHVIIQTVRLPRVLAGALIGIGLAAAGAVMQGVTGNPLAAPGILGINGGASLAVVIGVTLAGELPLAGYAPLAMLGAAIAGSLVFGLARLQRGEITPIKLTLAGVVISTFTSAITTAILVYDQGTFDQVRFWTVGSLAGRNFPLLAATAPYVLVGLILALILGRQITTLSLGRDTAVGLGQNTARVQALSSLAVILLAGGAVALAGPVGFVGLIVPHIVRTFAGQDYRWTIPFSALGGALLVTAADAAGRVLMRPAEIPIGVTLAVLGAPLFVAIIRSRKKV